MNQMLILFKQKRLYIGVGLVWIALWIIPWGQWTFFEENIYLVFLTDMIRLFLAIAIFVFPGVLLYLLLGKESDLNSVLRGIVPIGFTFSVAIIALVGLIGRAIGFSFLVVKTIFALIGLLELLILMLSNSKFVIPKKILWNSVRSILRNPPLLAALVLATLMTFHDYLFFIDDTTYLAYLTNWQHSAHLGFKNIIYDVNITEKARFWLAMYPMGQALLSNLSGVPGLLLLGNYLELFLVPLAVITSYWFARYLRLSPKAAGFAVLIQISLYSWMVGNQWPVGTWFYESMSEDKVSATFILAPVFFSFVLDYLNKPSKSKIILVIIGGASLELTHPVIMFLSVLIASGMGLISSITKKTRWQDLVVLFFIVASLMAPFGAIRLFEKGVVDKISYNVETASASYEIEKYTNIVNDVFYGLNPEVLMFFDIPPATPFYDEFQYFRLLPGLIAALAGILALAKLTDGPLHWYVFTSVFVVLLATLPYTGWLLGYFISARLISRASWFLPLGMGGIVILKSLLARINQNKKARLFKPLSYVLIIFCCLFVSPRIMFTILPRIPSYFLLLEKNKQLAQIGAYIDQNTSGQVMAIALDSWDTQLLPDVSAHTRLISFREEKDYNPHNYFLSLDEIHERIDASNSIQSLDQTVSADKRCAYIENYNVQFVLAQSDTVERFEKLISKCNRNNQIVFKTGDLVLLELK